MSLPQHLLFQVQGELYTYLTTQPTSANVIVKNDAGTTIIASTVAAIDSANTTINVAATKGDKTLTVASNAGIVAGGKYWIQDDPEEVLVRKVDGASVYLRRPVIYDHDAAAPFQGCKVSINVTSNNLFWDGRAEWYIDGTLHHHSAVECTRYTMDQATFSLSDLFDEEPKLYHIIDDEWDLVAARALARDDILKQVAAISVDQRARVFTSAHEFRQAAVFAALKRIYRKQSGEDAQQLYERYNSEFVAEISKVVGVVPRDADQDGTIEEDEKIYARSRRIVR